MSKFPGCVKRINKTHVKCKIPTLFIVFFVNSNNNVIVSFNVKSIVKVRESKRLTPLDTGEQRLTMAVLIMVEWITVRFALLHFISGSMETF